MASIFESHIIDAILEAETDRKLKTIRDELVLQRAMFIAAEKHRIGLTTDEQYKKFILLLEKETSETIDAIKQV